MIQAATRLEHPQERDGEGQEAVIILGGSFFPVHQGHLNALNKTAQIAENRGFNVVARYMALQPEGKIRKQYTKSNEIDTTAHRFATINLVSTPTPSNKTYGSSQDCAKNMVAKKHPDARIFIVVGSEFPKKKPPKDNVEYIIAAMGGYPCPHAISMPKSTMDVSSAMIRDSFANYPDDSLNWLEDALPPDVADYLANNPDYVEAMILAH